MPGRKLRAGKARRTGERVAAHVVCTQKRLYILLHGFWRPGTLDDDGNTRRLHCVCIDAEVREREAETEESKTDISCGRLLLGLESLDEASCCGCGCGSASASVPAVAYMSPRPLAAPSNIERERNGSAGRIFSPRGQHAPSSCGCMCV